MLFDTIAAISTPYSKGGIGIIRVSGENAALIVRKMFTGKIDASHTIRYGFVFNDETNEKIDEVLVSYMKAPNSYTKEDVVEINCHSGAAVLNQILELTIKHGARLADAGEFTKRAFLNGRIDLTKAEAVVDIINATNVYAAQNAVNHISGRLYDDIKSLMNIILDCLANIEASIDYPEHDDTDVQTSFLIQNISNILNEAARLNSTAHIGKLVKGGINTVITGATNVGKSSLLNYFTGYDRAIVTDIHGTTRDILEESVNLDGIQLNLIDTAGIRTTNDTVEKIGIEKAQSAAARADLVIAVFDASRPVAPEELVIKTSAHVIALINKSDLIQKIDIDSVQAKFGADNTFIVSVKNKAGLLDVANKIKRLFFEGAVESKTIITNARHQQALNGCILSLQSALTALTDGLPADIASVGLTNAYKRLSEITGDNIEEDLMDKIFSQFCLGK